MREAGGWNKRQIQGGNSADAGRAYIVIENLSVVSKAEGGKILPSKESKKIVIQDVGAETTAEGVMIIEEIEPRPSGGYRKEKHDDIEKDGMTDSLELQVALRIYLDTFN